MKDNTITLDAIHETWNDLQMGSSVSYPQLQRRIVGKLSIKEDQLNSDQLDIIMSFCRRIKRCNLAKVIPSPTRKGAIMFVKLRDLTKRVNLNVEKISILCSGDWEEICQELYENRGREIF